MPKPKREPLKTFGRGPVWILPRGYLTKKKGAPKPFEKRIHHSITSGVMFAVEDWMLAHPGQRLPTKEFAKQFSCHTDHVRVVGKMFETIHKLPERKRGGTHTAIPPECLKIMEEIIGKAGDGQEIRIIDVIKKMAKKTGYVISGPGTFKHLKLIAARQKKRPNLSREGIYATEWEKLRMLVDRLKIELRRAELRTIMKEKNARE